MRKTEFANDEYYHVYNRGVDRRKIFQNARDLDLFLKSLVTFNRVSPIGSVHELAFEDKARVDLSPLVEIIAYCLNPNHFHFLLRQKADKGISEFIKRVCARHTWIFNKNNKRTGALFEGRFKSKHVSDDEYLLQLACYVNLNNKVHRVGGRDAELVRSSWEEYKEGKKGICTKNIILDQFEKSHSFSQYAEEELPNMLERRPMYKELEEN